MTLLGLRLKGCISTTRIRIGAILMVLGAHVHVGLVDLAAAIEPRFGADASGQRSVFVPGRRPLFGLLVVVLLVAGISSTCEIGFRAIVAVVPHREERP